MFRFSLVIFWFYLFLITPSHSIWAQLDRYDSEWFTSGQTWIKLSVTSNAVYQVTVEDLVPHGFDTTSAVPSNVHIYEQGNEIPIEVVSALPNRFSAGDKIRWVGRRLTGKNELWAYRARDPNIPSSTVRSLYTDSLHYWLSWNDTPGLRYAESSAQPTSEFYEGYRDTTHLEEDQSSYYLGYDELAEMSTYTESEGFYWKEYNLTGNDQVVDVIEPQTLTDLLWRTDSLIYVTARFHGLSSNRVSANKRANINVFRDLDDGSGTGFENVVSAEWSTQRPRTITGSFPGYVLVDTTTLELQVQLENISTIKTGVNLVNLDWIQYSYYRGFSLRSDFAQFGMNLRADGRKSVRLKNLLGATKIKMYVPYQRKVIDAVVAGNTATFFNDTPSTAPTLHVMVKNDIYGIPRKISRVNVQPDLLSSSNSGEFLIVTRPMFFQEAQAYAQYRGNASGLTTKVVLMDDIWELFDYGLQRPIALRRFLIHALSNWEKPPKYMFIIGDGSDPIYGQNIREFEVPSFGIPSSDDWFSMNFASDSDWRPNVATGRLTVRTNAELQQYRNKVRNYERQLSVNPWQKRLALLSGGNSDAERATLLGYNKIYGNIAESSIFGADTVFVAKTSNDPLGLSPRQNLKQILDDGVLILHFFGHSAPNSWDLLTDDPADFNNVNRSSIVLSLGCYSGRFASLEERIISEDFVYADNASVAYVGGAGAGQIPALNRFGSNFYEMIFNREINVLGDVIKNTKTVIAQTQGQVFMDISLLQNSILLGDPALKLVLPSLPDYLFPGQAFEVTPNPTTIVDSTMKVNLEIVNWGKRAEEEMELKMVHITPRREINNEFVTIPNFSNSYLQEFEIPLSNESAGLHEFQFIIDEDRSIDEFSKANNSFFTSQLVFSTGVDIIAPQNFAKISPSDPEFVVSSPTITNKELVQFQIDSLATFFNPIANEVIRSEDVNIIWKPGLDLENGRTYYWRVRIVENESGGLGITSWRTGVFSTDSTVTNYVWFQNPDLYDRNQFSLTLKQSPSGEFEFDTVELPVTTSTSNYRYGADNSSFTASTRINGVEYGRRITSFHVLALDGGKGSIKIDKQYTLHPGQYAASAVNQTAASNQFRSDIASLRNGDIVITRVRHVSQVFPTRTLFVDSRILDSFNSIGGFKAGRGEDGTRTSQLDTNAGYILFGKKGATSSNEVSEYIVRQDQRFDADTVLTFNSPSGTMNSVLIGPAKSWNNLSYEFDLTTFAGLTIDVLGFSEIGGNATPLKSATQFRAGTNTVDISDISTSRYPYLRLRANLVDSTRRSTPQMPFWSVDYDPAPELTINPFSLNVPRDSVEEGFAFQFQFELQNIGLTSADTVEVIMSDRVEGGSYREVARDTVFGVSRGDSRQVSTEVPTIGLKGKHELLVEISPTSPDLIQYNNFLSYEYFVQRDENAPETEVIIENQYFPPQEEIITDKNDPRLPYVKENPFIEVRWRDANPFLRLDTPDLIEIDLNGTRYSSTASEIQFTAANSDGLNEAKVTFQPEIEVTSDSLFNMIIYARDKSLNTTQNDGYILNFKVTNESKITSFYPYPNPMTNFTYFAFELSGNEISNLERLRVTIFTMSGKPVASFDLLNDDAYRLEGGLRIGYNKFFWDGTDNDGARLANGVYLYHVDAKAQGNQLQVNNSNSIEKLVIIR